MYTEKNQVFVSRQSTRQIKVSKVYRQIPDTHCVDDVCVVVDIDTKGNIIPKSRRMIFADSIRRRYNIMQYLN